MFTRLVVTWAYYLKGSVKYNRLKRFFYDLLENPDSRSKSLFDIVMIALVMSSVFLLIIEIEKPLDAILLLFEKIVVAVFIVEYLLRVWIYNDSHKLVIDNYEKSQYLNIPFSFSSVIKAIMAKKMEYIVSPLALIDLIAIFPSYRSIRIFRLLIIFRLFKLFRYFSSLKLFSDVIHGKRFELITLAIFLSFLVFVGSIAIYLFENKIYGGQVNNLFEAIYFTVVTLSTVGYGDIAPQSIGGRVITIALIMSGIGVLAFFTSIIVTAFSERMQDLREGKTYAELKRLKHYIIICGYGRVGQHIARQLHKNHRPFVVIDINEKKLVKAKQAGYLVINADASNNATLTKAGILEGAQAILCTTGNDITNVYITLTSRYLNKNIHIISRANSQDNVNKLYQAGATHVIQPFEIAAMVAAEYIGQPAAFEAIFGIIREESHINLDALPVYANSFLAGKSLAQLALKEKKLLVAGVISENTEHRLNRGGYSIKNQYFYFNPDSDFVLQPGDLLVVFGRDLAIDYLRDKILRSHFRKSRS